MIGKRGLARYGNSSMNRFELRKFIRFAITGGLAALVDLVGLKTLVDLVGIDYLIATVIAYALAIIVNFSMQKFWVFVDKENSKVARQFSQFLALSLANLVINAFLMYLLVDIVGVYYLLAQTLILVFLTIINWALYGKIFDSCKKVSPKDDALNFGQ